MQGAKKKSGRMPLRESQVQMNNLQLCFHVFEHLIKILCLAKHQEIRNNHSCQHPLDAARCFTAAARRPSLWCSSIMEIVKVTMVAGAL